MASTPLRPLPRHLRPGLLALALAAALAGCSTTSPDVVQRGDAQRLATVQDATVLAVREVVVDGTQSGAGATAGGVVGGALGSTHGSGGAETLAVGVLAAVAGAVIGHAVERGATREQALELLLQMPSGERRAIVQARGSEEFRPGDAVLLVHTAGRARVTRAPAKAPAATAPASQATGAR
jgi:outer membrane lipoprotein SlyB